MPDEINPVTDASGALVPPPPEPPVSSGAADAERPDPTRRALSQLPIAQTVRDFGDRLMNVMDEAAETIRSAAGLK